MKNFLVAIYIICLASFSVFGQPNDLPPPNPDPVPITGIEYLLVGGGIYGIYRISKGRRKKYA